MEFPTYPLPGKFLALCILISCFLCSVAGQRDEQTTLKNGDTESKIINPSLDKYIAELLEVLHVPGLSVAVVKLDHSGSVHMEAKGYGYSSLPSTLATADTLYYTGSTTKAFTAAAAGKLVLDPDSPLTWNSRISQILPEDFALSEEYASSHTTLEDILSHRSGLPRHDLTLASNTTIRSTVQTMRHLPLTAEPRTRWQYCNLMYAVATDLLEKLTGKNLGDILAEAFWRPLGMQSTFFSLHDALRFTQDSTDRRVARGYYWVESSTVDSSDTTGGGFKADGFYVPEPYIDLAGISGAGATISTVTDYALWLEALLRASPAFDAVRLKDHNDSSPISPSLYSAIVYPRSIIPADFSDQTDNNKNLATPPNYALGWLTTTFNGHVLVAHNGGLPGFGTEVYLLPDDGLGIVTMGNTGGTSNVAGSLIVRRILDETLDISRLEDSNRSLPITEADATPLTGLRSDVFHLGRLSQIRARQLHSHPDAEGRLPTDQTPVHGASDPAMFLIVSDLQPFTGIYTHPAYGSYNVSIEQDLSSSSSFPSPQIRHSNPTPQALSLHMTPIPTQPHVVPVIFALHPLTRKSSSTSTFQFFDVQFWECHGPYQADPTTDKTLASCNATSNNDYPTATKPTAPSCQDEIVWETIGDGLSAYFEVGPDGEIDALGVELETDMILAEWERAQRDGERYDWRKGMIWFEKN